MGFWRRKGGSEQVSAESANIAGAGESQNAWEGMAASMAQERELAERERSSRERQQRKIIGYYMNGHDDRCLVARDVNVDAKMQDDFAREVGSGKITIRDEEELLLRLKGPIDVPERGMGAGAVFGKIAEDPWQLQLLNLATGDSLNGDDYSSGASAVARLVNYQGPEADYRTPVGFAKRREELLEYIRSQVDVASYEKYEESMDALEKNLYGKRFEYYQAFEDLRAQGEELLKTEAPTEQLVKRQEVYRLSKERSNELLRKAKIDGDPWYEGGRNYQLTPKSLKEQGLGPSYTTTVGGREIALSDIFELSGGRVAVEAYIPTQDGVKVRSYYRSNSQGVWRYLSDYVRDAQGGVN